MAYDYKYNTDDIFLRSVYIGLVRFLTKKLYVTNILDHETIELKAIPFIPDQGINERMWQDFFLIPGMDDCPECGYILGSYEGIPRGVVSITTPSIDTSRLNNRFIRGSYIKEINGDIQEFNSKIQFIPLSWTIPCKILLASVTDATRVWELIIKLFYRAQVFSVYTEGMKISSHVGFPDSYDWESLREHSFGSPQQGQYEISIDLEVETWMPVKDLSTEFFAGNVMENIIITS